MTVKIPVPCVRCGASQLVDASENGVPELACPLCGARVYPEIPADRERRPYAVRVRYGGEYPAMRDRLMTLETVRSDRGPQERPRCPFCDGAMSEILPSAHYRLRERRFVCADGHRAQLKTDPDTSRKIWE